MHNTSSDSIKPVLFFRQPISGLSHLLGAGFSIVGLLWIIREALKYSIIPHVISVGIFGASMFLLYLASALYHLLPLSEKGIQRLRKLDHSMIYVFIAGCYTPVLLIALNSKMGAVLFTTVWSVAAIGVILKLFWIEKSRWVRVSIYFVLSGMGAALIPMLVGSLPIAGFVYLGLGALSYTVGALVYALRWPNPFPAFLGFHEVWHMFVLLGSYFHFFFMKDYILSFTS